MTMTQEAVRATAGPSTKRLKSETPGWGEAGILPKGSPPKVSQATSAPALRETVAPPRTDPPTRPRDLGVEAGRTVQSTALGSHLRDLETRGRVERDRAREEALKRLRAIQQFD